MASQDYLWLRTRGHEYHRAYAELQKVYALMKMFIYIFREIDDGAVERASLGESKYSDVERKNVAFYLDRAELQNNYWYFAPNIHEFHSNVNYDEGVHYINNYLYDYTNSYGWYDYYWRVTGYAVVNCRSIDAYLNGMMNKGVSGKAIKDKIIESGLVGGEWDSLWGFKSEDAEENDNWATEWLPTLFAQWMSNLGGPK